MGRRKGEEGVRRREEGGREERGGGRGRGGNRVGSRREKWKGRCNATLTDTDRHTRYGKKLRTHSAQRKAVSCKGNDRCIA